MEIQNVLISELKPAEYNPRQMNKEQVTNLTASIKEFGLVDPIIVNSNPDRFNVIVGGHQRVEVAKRLGLVDVPVFYINLTLDKEKELNLRLNKNLGEWDWTLLANLDEELLKSVGFSDSELSKNFNTDDEVEGEEKFTSEVLEENNYIVLTFDNVMDWQVAENLFELESVNSLDSKEGYKRKGVGRVVDGKKLLAILEKYDDSNTKL